MSYVIELGNKTYRFKDRMEDAHHGQLHGSRRDHLRLYSKLQPLGSAVAIRTCDRWTISNISQNITSKLFDLPCAFDQPWAKIFFETFG